MPGALDGRVSTALDAARVERIILITAYSSPELYDAAQKLQVDHYLTKPVPLTLLRTIATTTLDASSAPLTHNKC